MKRALATLLVVSLSSIPCSAEDKPEFPVRARIKVEAHSESKPVPQRPVNREWSMIDIDEHGHPEDLSGLTNEEIRERRGKRRVPEFYPELARRQMLYWKLEYEEGRISKLRYFEVADRKRLCEFGPEPRPEGVHPLRIIEILSATYPAEELNLQYLRWNILKNSSQTFTEDSPKIVELREAMGDDAHKINWELLLDADLPDYETITPDEWRQRGANYPVFSTGVIYPKNLKLHLFAPGDPVCLQEKNLRMKRFLLTGEKPAE